MKLPRRRPEWLFPSLLYAVLAAAICGPAIVGRSAIGPDRVLDADALYGALPENIVPVHNDPTPVVLDLPRDLVFARGLHQGRIDAWNPHVGCGTPLWAEQGGPFFPLKLVFYLHPSRATHHLFLALRLVLAALGAFVLARRRGHSVEAALVAGGLFELSGSLFAHLPFAAASAVFMMPWVLLAAQLVAEARELRGLARATAIAAIVLGTTGHGGHPTLVAMTYIAFGFSSVGWAMERAWRERAAGGAVVALFCGLLAAMLGLAVAAPALLPLAELASVGRSYKDTHSGEGIWNGDMLRFRSTTPLALFAPHLLGTMRDKLDVLFPYLYAPTLGVLGLVLALAGVLGGGLRLSLALPALLGVALALAPWGLQWVHGLPVLRLIMPQYPWSLVQVPLVLCAATALDRLAAGRGRRELLGAALLAVAGAGTIAFTHTDPYQQFKLRELLEHALVPASGWVLLVAPLLAVVALAGAAQVGPPLRTPRGALLVGVAAIVELATVIVPKSRLPAAQSLSRGPSAPVAWLAERLDATQSRFSAIPYKVGFPNTPMVFGLDDFRQVSALPVRRYVDYVSAIGPPAGFTLQVTDRVKAPLYDLASVRYMVVRRVAAPPEPRLRGEKTLELRWFDDHVAIYENLAAMPRYRLSHELRYAKTREVSLYYAWGLGNPRGTPHQDAPISVEADALGAFPAPLPGGPVGADESVRRVDDRRDPDRLELEARLDRDGLVVVADTIYPGWEATVDGRPASIHAADELFRAVRVPEGRHHIVMCYRPRSLRLGGALCLVALGACVLLLRGSRRVENPALMAA